MSVAASSQVILLMPREKAWQTLRDLTQAANYVPSIIKTEITTTQKEGVGASRRVYSSARSYIEETVTKWTDGFGFHIKLHKGAKDAPFPMVGAWFSYDLKDAPSNYTFLTLTLNYTLAFGAFGAWLDKVLIHKIVVAQIHDVAVSMKYYYEHGRKPTKAQLKTLRTEITMI